MLSAIHELASLLRQHQIRVSTAEVVDAMQAAAAVGFADPEVLRAALAAALVKRAPDREVFDELFELCFRRAAPDVGTQPAALDLLGQAGISPERARELIAMLAAAAAGLGPLGAIGAGGRAAGLSRSIRASAAAVDVAAIQSPLQVGFYTYRALDALGVAAAETGLASALSALRGELSDRELAALRQVSRQAFARLRQAVRDHIDAEFRRRNLEHADHLAVRALAQRPLAQLDAREVAELRHEVARLARLLRARVQWHRRPRRRGRLDVRRTLRASLATGGVPVALVLRRRQAKKPRLVVLCDVSDSVRNVSRFMLELVYMLHALFDRVQSFAFVADIGELTALFRQHDLERAMELCAAGAAVNLFASSNYGRAFEQFAARHLGKVTRRTTVIVIGDGRNNYHPDRADVLRDIARRAHAVLWLNPESEAAWGFGDSAMLAYLPHCDRAVVARDLDSLRRVIDDLVLG